MVFGGVFSKPQLLAAMARVEKMAAEDWGRFQQNVPGNSPWECLDFGDTIVHVMSVEQVRWGHLLGIWGREGGYYAHAGMGWERVPPFEAGGGCYASIYASGGAGVVLWVCGSAGWLFDTGRLPCTSVERV